MADIYIDPTLYRSYDIRGVAEGDGAPLTPAVMQRIGFAYGAKLRDYVQKTTATIALVRDGRPTSKKLSRAFAGGAMDAGINIIDGGRGPTPLAYFSTYQGDIFAGAAMITASHNPKKYNGLKPIINHDGLYGEDIQELYQLSIKSPTLPKSVKRGTCTKQDFTPQYINKMRQVLPKDFKLKVAWDPGNGANAALVSKLVKRLPGEHIVINGTIDGTFPNRSPDTSNSDELWQLQEAITKNGCDIGFAFDGDGDRLRAITKDGVVMTSEQLILFLAQDILQRRPDSKIVTDVSCSMIVDLVLGDKNVRSPTGVANLKNTMRRVHAKFAGELSGHICSEDELTAKGDEWYGIDDGVANAMLTLRALHNAPMSMDEFVRGLPKTHLEVKTIPCPDAKKPTVIGNLGNILTQDGIAYSALDGVDLRTKDGERILLRQSNTEPFIRMNVESMTKAGLGRAVQQAVVFLERAGLERAA